MAIPTTPQEFADRFLSTLVTDRLASVEALETVAGKGKGVGQFTAAQLLEACALIRVALSTNVEQRI